MKNNSTFCKLPVDTLPPPWLIATTSTNQNNNMTTATLNEKDLLDAKQSLEDIKAEQEELRVKEISIREYIADVLHTEEEGSKTVKVGAAHLTITRMLSRRITKEEAERLSAEHPDIWHEAVAWRPEVKVSGYKDNKKIMDDYIVTKPGPPNIKFK